jgi:hypothetical protein
MEYVCTSRYGEIFYCHDTAAMAALLASGSSSCMVTVAAGASSSSLAAGRTQQQLMSNIGAHTAEILRCTSPDGSRRYDDVPSRLPRTGFRAYGRGVPGSTIF